MWISPKCSPTLRFVLLLMVIQVSYANEQPAFGCHAVLTDSIVDEQHTVKLPAATSMASQGVVRKKTSTQGWIFFLRPPGD